MKIELKNLIANDLFDIGSRLDVQDPCLQFRLGTVVKSTARQKDAGVNATFPETIIFDIDSTDLPLEVEVLNVNTFGVKSHIGIGQIVIRDVLKFARESKQCQINLEHRKKGSVEIRGVVKFSARIVDDNLAKPQPNQPNAIHRSTTEVNRESPITIQSKPLVDNESVEPKKQSNKNEADIDNNKRNSAKVPQRPAGKPFDKARLCVKRIEAKGLKNVEMLGGNNDPYAVLSIGQWRGRTATIEDGGSDVQWDIGAGDEKWSVDMSNAEMQSEMLRVVVTDANTMMPDKLIGEGEVSLSEVAHAGLDGGDIPLTVTLLDKNKKITGIATIFVFLMDIPVVKIPVAKQAPVPKRPAGKPFDKARLCVKRIETKGLKNVEMLGGNNDPYAVLSIGQWRGRTATIEDGGSDVQWDIGAGDEKWSVDMSNAEMQSEMLRVVLIGEGEVSLSEVAHAGLDGGKIALKVTLLDKKKKPAGTVTIYVCLMDKKETTPAPKRPAGKPFDKARLCVKRIEAKGLKNVEMLGGQNDPYVMLSFRQKKDWTARTETLEEGGSNVQWDMDDGDEKWSVDMSQTEMQSEMLRVVVTDANTMMPDKLIGEGEVSLSEVAHAGLDGGKIALKVTLLDKKKKPAGTVTIYVFLCSVGFRADESVVGKVSSAESVESCVKVTFVFFKNVLSRKLLNDDINVSLEWNDDWHSNFTFKENITSVLDLRDYDLSFECKSTSLVDSGLSFRLFRGKNYLGSGAVSLSNVIEHLDDSETLTADIFDSEKRPLGHLMFNLSYKNMGPWDSDRYIQKSVRQMEAMTKSQSDKLNELHQHLGTLEDSIRLQLRKELNADHNKLMELIADQNMNMHRTMEGLIKRGGGTKEAKPNDSKDDRLNMPNLEITEMHNVKLPADIRTWRAAHVQAWLVYRMDLRQYLRNFQEASVDGPVLMKYIGDEALSVHMGIKDPLHRDKIIEGIASLRLKQQRVELAISDKLKEKATLEKSHKKLAGKKKPKKDGKKKAAVNRRTASHAVVWDGVVKETNGVERAKFERDMRALQSKKMKKEAEKSSTWMFEYTGAPEGNQGLYSMPPPTATGSYRKTLKFLSAELSKTRELTAIPPNCPFEEVLAVVKGAMFEVSERLLKIAEIQRNKDKILNSDLESPIENDFGGQGSGHHGDQSPPPYVDSDSDDKSMPPPEYEETEYDIADNHPSHNKERIALIYDAFVSLHNNGAGWLGNNEKLTRMKFQGGLESILRLQMRWEQFDMLWTKLDYVRSGELDLHEFKKFFGDLSEFEEREGTEFLSTSSGTESMKILTKYLFELCDSMRHAGFTVEEVCASFDRNGSGQISPAEFCSMIRTVLGRGVDKKNIYRAFNVLDEDGSKTISKSELLVFVYKIWRSQLDELAAKLSKLDRDLDAVLIEPIVQERNTIKDAIKLNFSRAWRDEHERLGHHTIKGPFTALLSRMGLSSGKNRNTISTSASGGSISRGLGSSTATMARSSTEGSDYHEAKRHSMGQLTDPVSGDMYFPFPLDVSPSPSEPVYKKSRSKSGFAGYSAASKSSTMYSSLNDPDQRGRRASPISPKPSSSSRASRAGQNEISRMRLVRPEAYIPSREGSVLRQPVIKDMNSQKFMTAEVTANILRKNEPIGQKLFAMTK
eukprot:gene2120-4143_t